MDVELHGLTSLAEDQEALGELQTILLQGDRGEFAHSVHSTEREGHREGITSYTEDTHTHKDRKE